MSTPQVYKAFVNGGFRDVYLADAVTRMATEDFAPDVAHFRSLAIARDTQLQQVTARVERAEVAYRDLLKTCDARFLRIQDLQAEKYLLKEELRVSQVKLNAALSLLDDGRRVAADRERELQELSSRLQTATFAQTMINELNTKQRITIETQSRTIKTLRDASSEAVSILNETL